MTVMVPSAQWSIVVETGRLWVRAPVGLVGTEGSDQPLVPGHAAAHCALRGRWVN